MANSRSWPKAWVFGLLILPLGILVGFIATPLPFLLARANVPVERIATISSVANLPAVLVFLWAPVVDIKLRRRTWLVLAALVTSIFVCLFFPLIGASHLILMSALIVAGGIADSLVLAACGGLIVRALPETAQSKASAWYEVGFLGGGALGGAAVIWLAARLSLAQVGLCVAVLVALPAAVAFTIPEPPPAPASWFRGRFVEIGKETWSVVRSPERRWSALLLMAPGGTGAAQSLLPAIASHYGVEATGVMWTNGLAGGVALALGSLSATLVPNDWDRRLTYAGAGLTNAMAACILLFANRPSFYWAGTLLYLATQGLCWARFTALTVEIVGPQTRDASTLFSVLNSAGGLPVMAMIWLDGFGFQKFGTRGLVWTDISGNVLVFAVVAIIFIARGLGLRHGVPALQSERSKV